MSAWRAPAFVSASGTRQRSTPPGPWLSSLRILTWAVDLRSLSMVALIQQLPFAGRPLAPFRDLSFCSKAHTRSLDLLDHLSNGGAATVL